MMNATEPFMQAPGLHTHPAFSGAAERFAAAARESAARGEAMPAQAAAMLAVLREQREWRFFVDGTRNLGHQASTVAMIRRLVRMTAFSGRILVVYADYDNAHLGPTLPKLALLFRGLDPSAAEHVAEPGTCSEIRFVDIRDRASLLARSEFGFTGGADDMSVNYAEALNVRFFCRLQPYLWDDEASSKADRYYESSRIETARGRNLYLVDAYPAYWRLPFRFERDGARTQAQEAWRWYGDQQRFDPALKARIRTLADTLESRAGRSACLNWPLYGLHHFADAAAEIMLTCGLCALHIQRVAGRCVTLVDFSPLESASREARAAYPTGVALPEALRDTLLTHHEHAFRQGIFSHARLASVIEALAAWSRDTRADEVRVLNIGPVPADLFNDTLLSSPLPAVIEGQATASMLVSTGTPFVQLLRVDHAIKQCHEAEFGGRDWQAVATRLSACAVALRDLRTADCLRERDPLPVACYLAQIEMIASVMLDCMDARTEPARYFDALGRHFSKDANDRLTVGLIALHEVVRAAGPASGDT